MRASTQDLRTTLVTTPLLKLYQLRSLSDPKFESVIANGNRSPDYRDCELLDRDFANADRVAYITIIPVCSSICLDKSIGITSYPSIGGGRASNRCPVINKC